MGKCRKILQWGLPVLGIMIASVLCGVGEKEKLLQAQPLWEPPTNTGEELKKALLDGKPVLVDFGSNKCIPCRQLRPILKDVAQEFSGKAHVLIIDVFQYQELARQHRIHLIPTLVFFNAQGKETFRRSGVWDKASIAKKLKDAGTI
jgi:thioredoxin 1